MTYTETSASGISQRRSGAALRARGAVVSCMTGESACGGTGGRGMAGEDAPGVGLEVHLAEPGEALVVARRIEDRAVERQRFTDPFGKRRVIGKVVVGDRMD